MSRQNIVLIGMPSAGKTTIGKPLAEMSDMKFIDTDTVIFEKAGKPLRDIVNEDGLEKFLELQESSILELDLEGYVIATGGSVVYNAGAMQHLKSKGVVVYLKLELSEIDRRIAPGRRFARNEGQSFEDLYNERVVLYEKYADIIISCSGKQVEELVLEIKNKVETL